LGVAAKIAVLLVIRNETRVIGWISAGANPKGAEKLEISFADTLVRRKP
jgi:hypothetical protein